MSSVRLRARARSGALLRSALAAVISISALASAPAFAGVTFGGTSGNLSASALFEFDTDPTFLKITLTNTSLFDVTQPFELLSGVYFDAAGADLSKTGGSVSLGQGSHIYNAGSQMADQDISGEFAFKKSGSWAFDSGNAKPTYGISSAGLGWFSSQDTFTGATVPGAGNTPPDGLGLNITSAGDNMATPNNPGGVNSQPIVKNSVVIKLKIASLPSTFNLNTDISNVWFQYGTNAANEPSFRGTNPVPPVANPVPEPAFYAPAVLFGGGLIGMFLVSRRRRAGQDAGGLIPA